MSSFRNRSGQLIEQRPLPSPGRLARLWPWLTALIAAVVVNLIVGGVRHFDYVGILGFSTVNYGWLGATLVGGAVFGWRLAGRRQSLLGLIRPVLAAASAYLICFLLVTLTGLVFLPGQSLAETVTTDAPGRSFPVGAAVLVLSCAAEVIRFLGRRVRVSSR